MTELCIKLKNLFGPESDREKLWILIRMTFTIAFQFLGDFLLLPINVAFIGTLGEAELAAISLASSIVYSALNAVFRGLATGYDSFFAQAYGSGQKKLFGLLVLRGLLLQWLILALLMPVYLNMEFILILTGQSPDIARMAGSFFLWYCPFLGMMQMAVVLIKCLSCQNRDVLSFVLTTCSVPINTLLIYIFVTKLGGSVWSAGCSMGLSYTILGLLALVVIVCDDSFKTYWPGWTWLAFDDFWYFSKYCLNAMVVMLIDWATINVIIILSGYFGSVVLAAQGVFESLYMIIMTVPFGMCSAVSIQVGQAVGAMNQGRAARISRIAFMITNVYGAIIFPLLIKLSHVLPRIFTSSENVEEEVASLMPFIGTLVVFDSILYVGRGINRGLGNLTMALVVSLIGFIMFGLPLSIYLMFKTPLEIKGGWIGLACGMAVCGLFYIVYYCCYVSWDDVVQTAVDKTMIFKDRAMQAQSEQCSNSTGIKALRFYGTTSQDEVNRKDGENRDSIRKLRRRGVILLLVTVLSPVIGIVIRCTLPISKNTNNNGSKHSNSATIAF